MSELVGSFYILGDNLYLIINKEGTVRRLPRPSWWKVLKLYFYQYFGKKLSLRETIEYLSPEEARP